MRFSNDKHVLCLVYDGIKNSVFKSQVIQPLLKELTNNQHLHITLLSCEREPFQREFWHERITCVVVPRLQFFGRLSLLYAWWHMKRVLNGMHFDCVLARGPLAGTLALKFLQKASVPVRRCIIQARGLCAEEYRYSASQTPRSWIKRMVDRYLYHELKQLERCVYGRSKQALVTIEAVSPALKEYVIEHFGAQEDSVYLAQDDIPAAVASDNRIKFRSKIRTQLGISNAAMVYCYSGSYKPWQGVHEAICYFTEQHAREQSAILFILSSDVDRFKKLLDKTQLPATSYRIISVDYNEVIKYLCAAEYGFLFRDQDCINWVSRPTKMLEYEAANLKIIHNHTVAWLCQKQ